MYEKVFGDHKRLVNDGFNGCIWIGEGASDVPTTRYYGAEKGVCGYERGWTENPSRPRTTAPAFQGRNIARTRDAHAGFSGRGFD